MASYSVFRILQRFPLTRSIRRDGSGSQEAHYCSEHKLSAGSFWLSLPR
ncbi:hypothetical protein ANCCAN_29790 [Ancylostoma caninum]|uniref:Uncharacterized protein n=1 Tax=Ancylostoma caninum TaxID=29170 RepID=A0A368EXK9_ANCCA|nr:hypothetical protein ANCCAN_29790 [Ancylostoma caninum]